MLFNSMTDNYRNNQCVINFKSNFKTPVNKSNTRKPWRILCYNCNLYTESIEPIIIRRFNSYSFAFLAACNKWKFKNSCFIKLQLWKISTIILIYHCINHF